MPDSLSEIKEGWVLFQAPSQARIAEAIKNYYVLVHY